MKGPRRDGELLAGKYRLEELLGAGGMGQVYRARDEQSGRRVAVKLLRREHVRDEVTVQRFLRESRAANMVRHPNVVDVLDVGTDRWGVPFMVQELLEGRDLASHAAARRGRFSVRETLELMLPVLEAVGAAHAHGVVHRDLKPENIFLDERAGAVVPKVLDFGISKFAGQGHGGANLTDSGVTLGTPAYMAPEQIRGLRDVDARADVWALGVILFELLAARRPFRARDLAELFVEVCTRQPLSLAEVDPAMPASVVAVVDRCLRPPVDARYASAAEIAADLRCARDEAPQLEGEPAAPRVADETTRTSPGLGDAAREPEPEPE